MENIHLPSANFSQKYVRVPEGIREGTAAPTWPRHQLSTSCGFAMGEKSNPVAAIAELCCQHGDDALDTAIKPWRDWQFWIGSESDVHQVCDSSF
jgi:hypothetical protein